jgi:hypothetical protein
MKRENERERGKEEEEEKKKKENKKREREEWRGKPPHAHPHKCNFSNLIERMPNPSREMYEKNKEKGAKERINKILKKRSKTKNQWLILYLRSVFFWIYREDPWGSTSPPNMSFHA